MHFPPEVHLSLLQTRDVYHDLISVDPHHHQPKEKYKIVGSIFEAEGWYSFFIVTSQKSSVRPNGCITTTKALFSISLAIGSPTNFAVVTKELGLD